MIGRDVMTSDQWYNLCKLVIILAFAGFILYGIYRIMTRAESPDREDED